ncbi:hypothetical protein [Algoriphagus confluentis]|uniref:DUF3352 domain-containing protein n=1 Tax=Algoriphagus confluentis TaxID=1697556 RepID=A0ABQ6PJZ6_9BACT|nr:hypothetical protein Aconfl_09240 [Algoriphagus confluentis]
MKIWKSLLVLIALLALGWGGYTLYQTYFSSRSINNLELISSEAAFTFETNSADQAWNELVTHPVWDLLSQLPAMEALAQQLVALDSLTGHAGMVTKALRNKQITVSYHATGIDSFDLLYALNFGNQSAPDFLENFRSELAEKGQFKSRKYSDQGILEYIDASNNPKWTLTTLGNVLLISSTSFLIEEAIRLYLDPTQPNLSSTLDPNSASPSSLGRLILTSKGTSRLLAGISSDRENGFIRELASQDYSVALNLMLEENQIQLKGPVSFLDEVRFLPSVKANFPDFEKLISNNTLALTQINLPDIFQAQQLQNRSFVPKSTLSGEFQAKLLDRGFLDNFTAEQYLLKLENRGNQQNNLILLLKSNNPEQTWAYLNEFRNESDDLSRDFYRDNEILFFPEEELPAHLFSGKFWGFPQSHLTLLGEILVVANSASGMKMFLDDYYTGNTWIKAKANDPSPKSISPAAGYSKTFFLPKIWNQWTREANPSWSTFLQKYASVFRSFSYLTFRINEFSDRSEATILLPFQGEEAKEKSTTPTMVLAPNQEIKFDHPLTFGPRSVLNFNDKTQDLVLQDEQNTFFLVSSAGQTVFTKELSGPIVSEVFQIDYYKNGKLQLLFATADQVHGIDRLGNSLPGFPFSLGNEKITHLNLVDYDNSKDYRYFLATGSGNLWLTDRSGEKLEGWNPLALKETLLKAPEHIRVPGMGDYMVAQGKSGKLHLLNRRGERQEGGPIDFGAEITTSLAITKDKTPFQIQGISQSGELIRSGFSGEINYRNQLIKDNRDDRFELLSDQSELTYLILVRQFNKTLILDNQEKQLFSLPQSGAQLIFRYFDFGANRRLLAVTDPEQGFGYLYDLQGTLLTQPPLESEGPMQILHRVSEGQYAIYTRSGNSTFQYLMPD